MHRPPASTKPLHPPLLPIWPQLRQFFRHRSGRIGLTSVGVMGSVMLLRLTGLLQPWEWAAFDQFFRSRPLEPADQRIVIVGINESDIQKSGRWPIPDATLATLLQTIQSYQPRVIGLDLYRDLAVEPGHANLLKVYRSQPNLIGIHKLEDTTSQGVPAPPVLDQQNQIGFNNLVFDQDGTVRRGLLYWTANQQVYKSFALILALKYLQPQGITEQEAASNPNYLQLGKAVFRQFQSNDGSYIRADKGGYQFLANWRGPANHFARVSMTDVLQRRVNPELMRDRIVLIGSTAVSLKDYFPIAYSRGLFGSLQPISGVELQANLASQLISSALEDRTLIKVWPDAAEWLWVWAWAWLGAWLSWRMKTLLIASLAIALAGSGLVGLAYLVFLSGWWIPVIPALLALVGASAVITIQHAYQREELKRSKEFLNSIINTIPDPIFVKDQDHHWVVLNQAFCRLLGFSLEELLEKSDSDVLPKQEADRFRQEDQRVFLDGQERESEESLTDQQGVTYQIATKRSLHRDAAGNVFLVGVIRDITERKRMEEELKQAAAELARSNAELQLSANRLQHLATHDPLTGLPNRPLFEERLQQVLEWAASNHQSVALLFVDLDGFKQINDSQGHDVGDLLLKAVAQRLTRCLRGSDTVARLGGDEFTVILPAIPGQQDVIRVAEKILDHLSQPFNLEGNCICVTSSIGISVYPVNGLDKDILLKAADTAMYQAKERGKNRYELASLPPETALMSGIDQPADVGV